MQHLLTPYARAQEHWAWWEGAFNDEQLNWLQQQAKKSKEKASIGSGITGINNPDVRRSEISWLENNRETQWVFQILGHVVSVLNARFFGFNLTGFGEQIQLTNYDMSEQGMYGWHIDMGYHVGQPSRKLSVVVQLSDAVEYEGGVLELQPDSHNVVKVSKQRGLIAVFPSWTLHQVTPVTQGSRQSLVSWISGPPFI